MNDNTSEIISVGNYYSFKVGLVLSLALIMIHTELICVICRSIFTVILEADVACVSSIMLTACMK